MTNEKEKEKRWREIDNIRREQCHAVLSATSLLSMEGVTITDAASNKLFIVIGMAMTRWCSSSSSGGSGNCIVEFKSVAVLLLRGTADHRLG